ncbi:MAG: hypothetical protein J2P38_07635 [Candidatus Dormibacteraeota bacterium]|nr:hypothetical protein [Candidatus Dormibacteraeota bacterium]
MTLAAGALLVLAGCGSGTAGRSPAAHAETPGASARSEILHVIQNAFFSTTGAPADLRLTALREVAEGSTDWARATFVATRKAPPATRQAVAGGHDRGLLQHPAGHGWTWLGYLGASCRSTGPPTSDAVARLLGLPPVCAGMTTPSAQAPVASTGGTATTTLSSGDEATLLSIFVTAKNSGSAGQVLTPGMIVASTTSPSRAARVRGGGEWAMVTYVPAPTAPEPLTMMQLRDGGGTAFYSKQPGQGWVLRGFAGRSFCAGAAAARVPPAVLTLWGHRC